MLAYREIPDSKGPRRHGAGGRRHEKSPNCRVRAFLSCRAARGVGYRALNRPTSQASSLDIAMGAQP
jgi:hypothetical protein